MEEEGKIIRQEAEVTRSMIPTLTWSLRLTDDAAQLSLCRLTVTSETLARVVPQPSQ
jgi:hypothetical protein